MQRFKLLFIFVFLILLCKVADAQSKRIVVGYVNSIDGANIPGAFAETSTGFHFNNGLFLGAGTGIRIWKNSTYPDYRQRSVMIPLFIEAEYMFGDKEFKPYVNLKGGMLSDLTCKGIGRFIRPAIGLYFGNISVYSGVEVMMCDYLTETQTSTGEKTLLGNDKYSTSYSGFSLGHNGLFLGLSYSF